MNSKMKTIIGLMILALILGGAYIAYDALTESYTPIRPGITDNTGESDGENLQPEEQEPSDPIQAPDFTVVDWDGNPVKLSDYFGKPIVINFWASWCPPCREEMPFFETVYQEMKDEVHFLMINQTDGNRETRAQAEFFIEDGNYQFPVYFDEELEASILYGISALPTTLFIDHEGYILGGIPGAIDETTLREVIALLMD